MILQFVDVPSSPKGKVNNSMHEYQMCILCSMIATIHLAWIGALELSSDENFCWSVSLWVGAFLY